MGAKVINRKQYGNYRKRLTLYKVIALAPLLYFLSYATPPYGDPATNILTSKNLLKFGLPIDAAFNGLLVVRFPLYHILQALAMAVGVSFLVPPTLVLLSYLVMQRLHGEVFKVPLSIFVLLLPPFYILGSRVYPDVLVLFGHCLIYLSLFKNDLYSLVLSSIIVSLAKEYGLLCVMILLPLALLRKERRRAVLTAFVVSLILTLAYVAAIKVFFHGLFFLECYQKVVFGENPLRNLIPAFFFTWSSIIPWEVYAQDLQFYMPWLGSYSYVATYIIRCLVVVASALIFLPIIVGLAKLAIKSSKDEVVNFEILICSVASLGLWLMLSTFALHNGFDSFKVSAPFLPLCGYLWYEGASSLSKGRFKPVLLLCEVAILFHLALWVMRTLRLFICVHPQV